MHHDSGRDGQVIDPEMPAPGPSGADGPPRITPDIARSSFTSHSRCRCRAPRSCRQRRSRRTGGIPSSPGHGPASANATGMLSTRSHAWAAIRLALRVLDQQKHADHRACSSRRSRSSRSRRSPRPRRRGRIRGQIRLLGRLGRTRDSPRIPALIGTSMQSPGATRSIAPTISSTHPWIRGHDVDNRSTDSRRPARFCR